MANTEHLEMLRRGFQAWNAWRSERETTAPFEKPDLSGADLSGLNLNLYWLYSTDLHGSILQGTSLLAAELVEADLSDADLSGADLQCADLMSANLKNARIVEASFKSGSLSHADLTGADLTGCRLELAALQGANFSAALLHEAYLSRAVFNANDLTGADFTGATFFETILSNLDLGTAKGLSQTIHLGPSALDLRTLQRSRDIPTKFLKDCGLSDAIIDYLPSFWDKPIQWYSCFISFAEEDDDFAEKLYSDLTHSGIKCWRWKEDARWGTGQWSDIDQSIQLHDRLILVCSRHSLNSGPVLRELERALRREDELTSAGAARDILFPVRLDDYVFEWEHPRNVDVTGKWIGDFRDWTRPECYGAALERLIAELRKDTED
jgi:uncharacterized protein YjbI with pentapeptide repeats